MFVEIAGRGLNAVNMNDAFVKNVPLQSFEKARLNKEIWSAVFNNKYGMSYFIFEVLDITDCMS